MNKNQIIITCLISALIIFSISACMPNPGESAGAAPSGFFKAVWHGWIAPISLIVGFFNDSTRVYDPNNTGWWYDFGFYIAVISGFGGLSLARKKQMD
ncbi:hypothetical protein HQ531_10600 [bacterium]|nr:hypothetical protein [bacterium]